MRCRMGFAESLPWKRFSPQGPGRRLQPAGHLGLKATEWRAAASATGPQSVIHPALGSITLAAAKLFKRR